MRTLGAVDRSDVTVMRSMEGWTEQDKRIAGYAHEKGAWIILAVNKWDLVAKETNMMRDMSWPFTKDCPFCVTHPSCLFQLNGAACAPPVDMANTVNEAQMRIPTGRFNQILQDAVAMNQPPSDKGVPLKIYYGSQVQVKPPVFVLHVNRKDLLHFSYERYLENRIRQEYEFIGTPIMLVAKERSG